MFKKLLCVVAALMSVGINVQAQGGKTGSTEVLNNNAKLQDDLDLAVFSDNFEKVKKFLDEGADVNYQDYTCLTPLAVAALCKPTVWTLPKKLEIIKLLIGAGADVNSKNCLGDTPLMHVVAFNTDKSIIQLLVDAGADLNAQNSAGLTALMRRSPLVENLEIRTFLVAMVKLDSVTSDGQNALHQVALNHGDDYHLVDQLLCERLNQVVGMEAENS